MTEEAQYQFAPGTSPYAKSTITVQRQAYLPVSERVGGIWMSDRLLKHPVYWVNHSGLPDPIRCRSLRAARAVAASIDAAFQAAL